MKLKLIEQYSKHYNAVVSPDDNEKGKNYFQFQIWEKIALLKLCSTE